MPSKKRSRLTFTSSVEPTKSPNFADDKHDAYAHNAQDVQAPSDAPAPDSKRQKMSSSGPQSKSQSTRQEVLSIVQSQVNAIPCSLPTRQHSLVYHQPILLYGLHSRKCRDSLLRWFDSKSTARSMPWRKPWKNPELMADPMERRHFLERRAYEVWVSEIMLQQTRVAVVIDYWTRWMLKWPTIQDLAHSDRQEVLAAWQGLGYYSRATRLHEAAKLVAADPQMKGLLPETAQELEAKVPGVGRYTAGAISSIVFGRAEPMVDGNVLRVLSRQLGIFGNVKTNKAVIDTLWSVADALVKTVALDAGPGQEEEVSDRPGRWGQGLMELGSTLCTPKPNCAQCPIKSTCRAYSEGRAHALAKPTAPGFDIETTCTLCEPFQGAADSDQQATCGQNKQGHHGSTRQTTLGSFFFSRKPSSAEDSDGDTPSDALPIIIDHARKFPVRVVKKDIRKEAILVCIIRRSDGRYLIHRRPDKGLLAGLWEFPSQTLGCSTNQSTSVKARQQQARTFVSSLFGNSVQTSGLDCAGEIGIVPWTFSHLKLTMHVHLFTLSDEAKAANDRPKTENQRWSQNVDQESMGTGMRRCWELVRNAE